MLIGVGVTFLVIFNLRYVFHEILRSDFLNRRLARFNEKPISFPQLLWRLSYIYTIFQAYFLPIYHQYAGEKYGWSLNKTAFIFGAEVGFFRIGPRGGMIEVAVLKMPGFVCWVDSGYHTCDGVLIALILTCFYKKYQLITPA